MIELRHLRYFIAVAEELNFARAAERVHIDQTPLSRTVRDLEGRLGVQLFERGPRRLRLTPAGLSLLKEARKIFIRIERAYRVVRQTDARFQPPLRIGVADGISQPRLSESLQRWHRLGTAVPIELTELRAHELTSALEHEELDIGFSFGVSDDDAIEQQPAWSYPAMGLLPSAHQLTGRGAIQLSDLLAFPLLTYQPRRLPGLAQQVQSIVQRYASDITIAGEAGTLAGYVTRIAAGLGVGLLDTGHASILRRDDVVPVRLAEVESLTTFMLVKRRRFGLPDPLSRFIDCVRTAD